jgi:dihydrofolate reductase
MTNGWNGKPAAGEHVFVVTHQPPADWEHADTAPFTFVNGVEKAIAAAQEFAGDRVVDVAAGQIGGQALRLGLIDQVVVNLVPVVFGSGRPFFATGDLAGPFGWRTRPRSCQATGSPTWSTTSAAEARCRVVTGSKPAAGRRLPPTGLPSGPTVVRAVARRADVLPHTTEAVWTLADDRSVDIVEQADGAGNSVVTIFVDDRARRAPHVLQRRTQGALPRPRRQRAGIRRRAA